jgi:hypothetical protein
MFITSLKYLYFIRSVLYHKNSFNKFFIKNNNSFSNFFFQFTIKFYKLLLIVLKIH